MKDYFLRLYIYNNWANEKYFDLLKRLPNVPERIHLLFSHTVVAQRLWLKRIVGDPDLSDHIWTIVPWEELHAIARQNNKNWLDYLNRSDEAEFSRVLSYYNFQKIHYNNLVSDIIIHTANHGTYHRAQFAILLRQNNIDPPNTDFITFVRETEGSKVG